MQSVNECQKEIDSDKFLKASLLVHKLQSNKDMKCFVDFLKDSGDSASDQGGALRRSYVCGCVRVNVAGLLSLLPLPVFLSNRGDVPLPEIAKQLGKSMVAAVHKPASEPLCWFRALVRLDKHHEVMKLDAASRCKLGSAVERQIRSVQRIMDHASPPDTSMGKVFSADDWRASEQLTRDGLAALNDVFSFSQLEDAEGFEGLQATLTTLKSKAQTSIEKLASSIEQAKSELSSVYAHAALVQKKVEAMAADDICPKNFDEEVCRVVKIYNEDFDPMQNAVAGQDLFKLEVGCCSLA